MSGLHITDSLANSGLVSHLKRGPKANCWCCGITEEAPTEAPLGLRLLRPGGLGWGEGELSEEEEELLGQKENSVQGSGREQVTETGCGSVQCGKLLGVGLTKD